MSVLCLSWCSCSPCGSYSSQASANVGAAVRSTRRTGAAASSARSSTAAASGVNHSGPGRGPSAARQMTAPSRVRRPESLTCAGPRRPDGSVGIAPQGVSRDARRGSLCLKMARCAEVAGHTHGHTGSPGLEHVSRKATRRERNNSREFPAKAPFSSKRTTGLEPATVGLGRLKSRASPLLYPAFAALRCAEFRYESRSWEHGWNTRLPT
jgi:hypothetical protein